MSDPITAHAAIRQLVPEFTARVLRYAAELRTALQSAHDMLAPIADEHEGAAVVFQLVADALASADAPESPHSLPV